MYKPELKRYFTDIKKYKVLPTQELYHYATLASQGDQKATEIVARSTIKYATELALDFAFKNKFRPDDCVCAALEGLLKGIRQFDPSKSKYPLACYFFYVTGYLKHKRAEFDPQFSHGLMVKVREYNKAGNPDPETWRKEDRELFYATRKGNLVSIDEELFDDNNTSHTLADEIPGDSEHYCETPDIYPLLSTVKDKYKKTIYQWLGVNGEQEHSITFIASQEKQSSENIHRRIKHALKSMSSYLETRPELRDELLAFLHDCK